MTRRAIPSLSCLQMQLTRKPGDAGSIVCYRERVGIRPKRWTCEICGGLRFFVRQGAQLECGRCGWCRPLVERRHAPASADDELVAEVQETAAHG